MDKVKLDLVRSDPRCRQDSAIIAETIHRDFRELATILARRLGTARNGDCNDWAAILHARVAAERGVGLSSQLVEMLRVSRRG